MRTSKDYYASLSNLLLTLKNDANQLRYKSVQATPAQFIKLCSDNTSSVSSSEKLLHALLLNRMVSSLDKLVIFLCFKYGCRISEVLNISYCDFVRNDTIIIHGLKKSSNRVIVVSEITALNIKRKLKSPAKLFNSNRYYYYRLFKKLGFCYKPAGNINLAVTHAGRYHLANDLMANEQVISNVQVALGHKSVKSSRHYVK